MPTPQKEQLVAEVAEELKQSAGFYLLSFSNLSVAEMSDLRGQVKAAGGRLQVIKNRLIKRALDEETAEALGPQLEGPTILAFCAEDAIGPAQALDKFAADHPGLAFKAGWVEGRVVSSDEAQRIAKLPPREQILAEALAALQGPAASLVGLLNAAIGELVFVMEAQIEKQEAA
ncbi:MAG: 50S ribosomal protein L10 [candidate division WS1 bacterium]|jgi:large subunit ribosomal protein L10|nr:50S ribosomal protein L10 [candidate division WS1 bacterium]